MKKLTKRRRYYIEVDMSRSRRPQGEPPFSNIFIYLTEEEKLKIFTEALNQLQELYDIEFFDPIRDRDFYYNFTHFKPGLYIFGDNGLFIVSEDEFYMYDLSVSDVLQGYIRRSEDGKNFKWFIRLTPEIDLGPTGDPFTTLWNIEGQLIIWRSFLDGKFPGDKIPYHPEFMKPCKTFLGHFYDKIRKIWRTTFPHLTTDRASKRKTFNLRKNKYQLHLSHKGIVDDTTMAQICCSTGVVSFKLADFYEWIRERRILSVDFVEGASYRILEMIPEDMLPDFMMNFDIKELEKFAWPLKVQVTIKKRTLEERVQRNFLNAKYKESLKANL